MTRPSLTAASNQQNAHVYAFYNAPLHEKVAATRIAIAKVRAELDGGNPNRSADGYYALKDELRRLSAGLARKTECQYDPMGFWFGRQS